MRRPGAVDLSIKESSPKSQPYGALYVIAGVCSWAQNMTIIELVRLVESDPVVKATAEEALRVLESSQFANFASSFRDALEK